MKLLQKVNIVYDSKYKQYIIPEKYRFEFEIDSLGDDDIFNEKWSKYKIDYPVNNMGIHAILETSNQDAEDILTAIYEELKSDFEMLWIERNDCFLFENWWSDFLKFKLNDFKIK